MNPMAKTKHAHSADNETFLTKQELARILKVTPRTLEQWAKQKRFPVYRLGRVVRYKRDEVTQALAAHRVEPKRPNRALQVQVVALVVKAFADCCRLVEAVIAWL